MGIYLVLYLVSLVLALFSFFISRRRRFRFFESIAIFFMVLMIFFFTFALVTNDPIEEILTTIPAFWQFLLTALGGAFTIWKVYLNPLKERVIRLETNMASLISKTDTNFSSIKEDLKMLKDKLLGRKS